MLAEAQSSLRAREAQYQSSLRARDLELRQRGLEIRQLLERSEQLRGHERSEQLDYEEEVSTSSSSKY